MPYDFLILNADFKFVKGDAKFQQIVSDSKKQFDQTLSTFQAARTRGEFPQYLEKPLADLLKKLNYK